MLIIKILMIASLLLIGACKEESRTEANAVNLKLIQLSMKDKEVRTIMGSPQDTVIFPHDSLRYSYMYEAPNGYSDNFYIFLDAKDSVVVSIGDGL